MHKTCEAEKFDMTPMIDIVFQLLIFFVLTLKPLDIIAHLDVNRPTGVAHEPSDIAQFQITVKREGFAINDRLVSTPALTAILGRISHFSTNQTVIVACDQDADHAGLIQALDICHSVGLDKIALVSR